jgi:hypothetical protein
MGECVLGTLVFHDVAPHLAEFFDVWRWGVRVFGADDCKHFPCITTSEIIERFALRG